MKLAWIQGYQDISWNKTYTWLVIGVRGAGKSAFLEHLAEQHLEHGNCVLDLFAARSGENLAWLRSKWAGEKRILLLSAENAKIQAKGNFDVKTASSLSLSDFEDYDIIINSCVFYPSIDAEFEAVNNIIDRLWQRRRWKRLVFVICREAANIVYSRMKIAESQTLAKTFLAYWLRESRHTGCSIALDSQRFMALDVDIRSLIDFLVFKAQGALGLPRDLHFIYSYIEPAWLQYAKPNEFCMLTRRGDVAIGVFPQPEWHAKEGEDVPGKLGLKVLFEEQPEEGRFRGAYKTIGDQEHASIIKDYIEGLSMKNIAEKLGRSTASIKNQIDRHNQDIAKIGYCPKCRHAKSSLEQTTAKRIEKE